MKHVYIVIARHYGEDEILYVFKLLRDAKSAQATEQENFRASGDDAKIVIEKWDVF